MPAPLAYPLHSVILSTTIIIIIVYSGGIVNSFINESDHPDTKSLVDFQDCLRIVLTNSYIYDMVIGY